MEDIQVAKARMGVLTDDSDGYSEEEARQLGGRLRSLGDMG